MDSVTAAEIAKLETMTVSKLVEKFESLVGEKCRSRNKRYLVRRIAWRLQANAEGGLSERALKRAAELALDSEVRVTPPREHKRSRVVASTVESKPVRDLRLPLVPCRTTGSIHCQRKRNGSTRAGEARCRLSVLAMIQASLVFMVGRLSIPLKKAKRTVTRWARKGPMNLACTTCTAMFGNGAKITLVRCFLVVQIQSWKIVVLFASIAAGAGTFQPSVVDRQVV